MKSFAILFLVGLVLTLGCSKDSDDGSPTATINHAPVIQSMTTTPATARQNDSWGPLLQCIATDADGDSLKYYWSCDNGSLDGAEDLAPSVRYYAGSAPRGDQWIKVQVSDSHAVVIDSVKVVVIPN